jgi:CDP-4-dehydro-6-deoxyglucose reductase
MATTWYDGEVTEIIDETPTTKRFWVKIPDLDRFDFQPGQFVTMDLPIHEKRLQRWRSYSIANSPTETNTLEFCIVKLAGGLATQYLFDEIRTGSAIRFKGPNGVFTLPSTIEKDLVMICTGTGVAPFRSMLQHLQHTGKSHCNIHLIFGTRFSEGILYRKEFETLQKTMPGFHFSVALSKEESIAPEEFEFEIKSGYVHQLYQSAYAPREDVLFYLCGWQNMVDEAVLNLQNMGFQKSHLITELYG